MATLLGEDRKIYVNNIPLTVAPCAVSSEGVKIVPPPWEESDFGMLCGMTAMSLLSSAICLFSYFYGYDDYSIDDEDLLPVQLLAAVFLGIAVGLGFYIMTRTFYNGEEVLRALKAAHKTETAKIKKFNKTLSSNDNRKSRPTLGRRVQGKRAR
eukprot:m.126159 g.126159  ORF g.126159 m.126159 type:complete len:154 (+) comp29184_c0_seq1:232-693(+)